ncbi:PLP-dependent aminotransferase family protein [Nocardioides sp. 616]|uniref:aminotransferase-like domain-containing protein n=1 Tax=Nocardioides sp. 616 TaxID=2268090 RepID=UPI000CE3E3B1|nr:PLP-dependent aminotransferase family protein [Nocardioides sp. 616]
MEYDSSAASTLADKLAVEIEMLPEGRRVPSQRVLVRRFGASATTVAQALRLLTQRGLVETHPGSGTFRARTGRPVASGDTSWQEAALELTEGLREGGGTRRFGGPGLADVLDAHGPDVIDLNGGYLHPELQPSQLLRAALTRAAKRVESWERPAAGGIPELRDWFARDIGGGLGRSDVLVCGAGQAALATTMRALAQPGDPVVVEAPTYPGTMAAALAAGLRPVPVPLDAEGIVPQHLDDALARARARVVVVQPRWHNPTGVSMSPGRCAEVRRIAKAHDAFVVEDDFVRHLDHADAPVSSPPMVADDADGTVIHIRSLTKATSPNLRIGAIAARGPVVDRLRAALLVDTILTPAPLQLAALEVVTSSGWRRHLTTLGVQLQERREIAARAAVDTFGEGCLPTAPRGGYHLWVALPRHADGAALARRALTLGVAVTPGSNYYLPGTEPRPNLRLSYVATPSGADLETGIRRLRDLLPPP